MKYLTLTSVDPAGLDHQLNELVDNGLDVKNVSVAAGMNRVIAIIAYDGEIEEIRGNIKAAARKVIDESTAIEAAERARIDGDNFKRLARDEANRLEKIAKGRELLEKEADKLAKSKAAGQKQAAEVETARLKAEAEKKVRIEKAEEAARGSNAPPQ